jgi:hypothetical protein
MTRFVVRARLSRKNAEKAAGNLNAMFADANYVTERRRLRWQVVRYWVEEST